MLLATKHFDPVIGIDVHTVLIPPAPSPVPVPHPHVGFVLDLRELSEGFKAAAQSMVMSIVEEKVADALAANPELVDKAMPLIAEGAGIANSVLENPAVATGLAIKNKYDQATGLLNAVMGDGGNGAAGRPVFINGIMRATAGTHTFHLPGLHFPLGTGFGPPDPVPSQDSEAFMGSKTVLANNDPLSFCALPAMSCWMNGLPPLGHNSAHTNRQHTSLPTSVMLPIPAGRPVLVGGPPTVNMLALAAAMFKAFRGSKWAKALADKLKLKSGFLRCVVLKAEPVHAISGEVVVEQNDFTLPGRLPLVWDRYYAGHSQHQGALGYGWQSPADIRLELMHYDGVIGVVARFPDHETAFDLMPQEQGWQARLYDWQQGHALYRDQQQLVLRTRQGIEYRFTLPTQWEQQIAALPDMGTLPLPLTAFNDLNGNSWQFIRRANGTLAQIQEARQGIATGRAIECQADPDTGLLTVMTLLFAAADTTFEPVRFPLRRYQQDQHRDLVAVFDELNVPYGFTYEAQHRMTRHTDRNGLSFYYSYQLHTDGVMRVDHAWGDGGLFDYRFVYDLAHRETHFTDSLGHTAIMQYDDRQLPIAEIDPLGGVHSYQYDRQSRACAEIDPLGNLMRWEYDERGNLLCETQADKSTIRTRYDANNRPTAFTDQEAQRWQQEWDERGNVISQTTPAGIKTHYTYDDAGQLVAATVAEQPPTLLSYDGWGYLATLTSSTGAVSRFEHDQHGCLRRRLTPDGGETLYDYDNRHRLSRCTLPDNSFTTYTYDNEDNLLGYVENNERVTEFSYFGQGQLQSRTAPDGSRVEYQYDTEQQLIGVKNQRGQAWHLKRDPLGRLSEEIDYQGQARRYRYNLAGHLLETTDPLGNLLRVTCDKLGRITEKHYAQGESEHYQYNPRGQLTQASNADAVIVRRYTPDGALAQETQTQAQLVAELHYRYDPQGRLMHQRHQMQHRGASQIQLEQEHHFRYDDSGFLVGHQIDDHPEIRAVYDNMGRLSAHHLTDNLSHHFTYTALGQRHKQITQRNGQTDGKIEYHYDRYGNLTCRDDSRLGSDHFRYDVLGQILAHTDPAGKMREYQYNACGDRFQVAQVEEGGRELHHDDDIRSYQDRAGKTLWRKSREGLLRFTWNPQERLEQLDNGTHRWHYRYDALGRRIAKTQRAHNSDAVLAETWFMWDGDAMVGELTTPVALKTPTETVPAAQSEQDEIYRIIWGEAPPQPTVETTQPGYHGRFYTYHPGSFEPLTLQEHHLTQTGESHEQAIYYYQNDVNGMPLRLRDSSGAVIWLAHHNVFGGVEKIGYNQVRQPLRLQGQYHDQESGLHYNRYRYYDPDCGMFISQDPIGLAGGINPYQFAVNTLGWVDPWGLTGNPATATHITYMGIDNTTGKPYVGYASMQGKKTGQQVLSYRYSGNFDRFGGQAPRVLYEGYGQDGKDVARGLEQRVFEDLGGTNRTANRQNPVGQNNGRRDEYLDAADEHRNSQNHNTQSSGCQSAVNS